MNLEELKLSGRVIFECRAGSFAYGTNTEKSDIDIKGIFTQSQKELISFKTPDLQISDEKNDIVYYSLRRYIELASVANPNILELLFMPQDCILHSSKIFEKLKNYRNEFISHKCLETHQAYAMAQIKKAKGRNKWINNPQAKEKPIIENFTHFISMTPESETPARPTKYPQSLLYKGNFKASSVEHCPGLYRIYKSNKKSKLFTDNQICCSSIPYEEENLFTGLLYFNENAYKKALTDHKNYWEWMSKRNPERWKLQEAGSMNYDVKNMQHTIRLLLTAKHIAEHQILKVRFNGPELKLLKEIRLGAFSYKELITICEDLNSDIDSLSAKHPLREEISIERSTEIFLELINLK